MDAKSAVAILDIFTRDVESLLAQDKGKQREGVISESNFVLEEHLKELRTTLRCVKDNRVAHSISRACEEDAAVIAQLVNCEEQAARDHDMALRLSGMHVRPRPAPQPSKTSEFGSQMPISTASNYGTVNLRHDDLSIVDDLALLSLTDGPSAAPGHAKQKSNSISTYRRKRKKQTVERVACILCEDSIPTFDSVKLPCDPQPHTWCRRCIVELFEASINDEQLHPPRCCRDPIDLEGVKHFLSRELVVAFLKKTIEFSTANRTYCFEPHCSTFIPSEKIKDGIATCSACHSDTCVQCKHKAHHNTDCPEDPSVQAVISTAKSEGWRQCPECKRMIELSLGCYHMTYVVH